MSFNCVRVIVHLERLRRNLRKLERLHSSLLPIIKADAYGHGCEAVARTLEEEGIVCMAVGTVEEGVHLRGRGIRARLLNLMGPVDAEDPARAAASGITMLVHDGETLRRAAAHGASFPLEIAIKFDSGMSRLGFPCEEAPAVAEALRAIPALRPVLAVSHLACADEPLRDACTHEQASRFYRAVAALRTAFPDIESSLGNSSALLGLPGLGGDRVRPGLALYGVNPLRGTVREGSGRMLEPVMEAWAPVLSVHVVRQGAGLSYGHTFTAPKDMRIAVIGAGYADGWPRALSGKGSVTLHGRRFPIVGRVCMQMTLIDVTGSDDTAVGDRAFLLGGPGPVPVSADEIADLCGTIPYEPLCSFGRNPRRFTG